LCDRHWREQRRAVLILFGCVVAVLLLVSIITNLSH
jgi:hypothetical protein